MALALELFRSAPRYLAARAVGDEGSRSGVRTARAAPSREPQGPCAAGTSGWARVKPAARRDLRHRPRHARREVIVLLLAARVAAVRPRPRGRRRAARRRRRSVRRRRGSLSSRPDRASRAGSTRARTADRPFNRTCDRVTTGHVRAGLQTGYCTDTGGGWSRMFVAHRSQLHRVPDSMSDDARCSSSRSRARSTPRSARTCPNGGSCSWSGPARSASSRSSRVKQLTRADHVIVVAKHPAQRVAARLAGADVVVIPEHATNAVRRSEPRDEAHARARASTSCSAASTSRSTPSARRARSTWRSGPRRPAAASW